MNVKGVYNIKGKWTAKIGVNYKLKSLGTFITKEEAISARLNAEKLIASGDKELKTYKIPIPNIKLTSNQESILIGSLLGDGHLNIVKKETHNSFFVKKQALRRFEYLQWHFKELEPLSSNFTYGKDKSPNSDRIIYNCRFFTKRKPLFTEMRKKWYPEGIKIVPDNIKLDPLAVAIWFADDGCNQKRRAKFCTDGFSDSDREILIECLKKLGIQSYSKELHIKIPKKPYLDLMEMIKPFFVWKCFDYKTTTVY